MRFQKSYFRKPLVLLLLQLFSNLSFSSDDGILLNCDRYEGTKDLQIYINEDKGYVLYNAQTRDNYDRTREYQVVGSASSNSAKKTNIIDEGIDITENNSSFIIARDDRGTFVFTKKNLRYAYAWAQLVPDRNGEIFAFANSHIGACQVNPFSQ